MSGKAALFSAAALLTAGATMARADEADAKRLLKAMSDYMAAQEVVSFDYDTTLEVITSDLQKLALASSGQITMHGPDKLKATRQGGFANVDFYFDGKTLTTFGKDANLYAEMPLPGTIDDTILALREKLGRPIPGADLLESDVYATLMDSVVDLKDLGSGVIGGMECDHLAARTNDVDWQIWIAHGDKPYPCRYSLTSKMVAGAPQYSVDISNWKTGADVAAVEYTFTPPAGAEKVSVEDLPDMDELPNAFSIGGEM
jgi:hypothetical protein